MSNSAVLPSVDVSTVFRRAVLLLAAQAARTEQQNRITQSPDDPGQRTERNFRTSARWLDSLGVPRTATLLVLDARSYNLPLLLAQRPGWTAVNTAAHFLTDALKMPADYVVTQNFSYLTDIVYNYPLITERLIDYIRIHVTQAGGLTPCRKVAALGEAFHVKTAWHGPGDVSPIGHMANVTLDLACYNFGIQEYSPFSQNHMEVFDGCPVMKNGYLYANEKPGWGIEVNEKTAAKFPYGATEQGERKMYNGGWGEVRRRDGTIIKQ